MHLLEEFDIIGAYILSAKNGMPELRARHVKLSKRYVCWSLLKIEGKQFVCSKDNCVDVFEVCGYNERVENTLCL